MLMHSPEQLVGTMTSTGFAGHVRNLGQGSLRTGHEGAFAVYAAAPDRPTDVIWPPHDAIEPESQLDMDPVVRDATGNIRDDILLTVHSHPPLVQGGSAWLPSPEDLDFMHQIEASSPGAVLGILALDAIFRSSPTLTLCRATEGFAAEAPPSSTLGNIANAVKYTLALRSLKLNMMRMSIDISNGRRLPARSAEEAATRLFAQKQ